MTYLAQFGFPCCALVYDSRILSISYLDTGVENFSNKFIDVPLNFSTSMTAFVCYSLITIKIWRSKKLTVTAGGLQTSSGNKEYAFIIVPFDVTLIYVFHGLCQFTGPLSCKISLSIFYHCFPHNVWSLLLSFSYRYYVLHHHQLSRRVLVLIILIIYMPSLTQALVYWPSIADKEDIMPYANRFYPQYNLSNADGLLAGIPTIREFASIFVIGHLCIPIFPIYITIFVLRHKVMKELLKKTAMLSRDAKSYHSQILKCLTIQAIIPLIFVIGVMSYISAQLGIFTNPFLEYSIFACTLPMPMFSPFTYLLYIQPYRMFCLRLIKRKEGESSQAERSKQVLSL